MSEHETTTDASSEESSVTTKQEDEELAYGGVCPVCGDEFTDGFDKLEEGESQEDVRVCVVELKDGEADALFHLPDDQEDPRQPPQDQLADLTDEIREYGNFGEMMMAGDVGYHTFFDPEQSDYGIGTMTALHMAFDRTTEEVCLDEDIVRHNRGRVTPKHVADELEEQLEDFVGQYRFFEMLRDNFEEVLGQAEQQYGEIGDDEEVTA